MLAKITGGCVLGTDARCIGSGEGTKEMRMERGQERGKGTSLTRATVQVMSNARFDHNGCLSAALVDQRIVLCNGNTVDQYYL